MNTKFNVLIYKLCKYFVLQTIKIWQFFNKTIVASSYLSNLKWGNLSRGYNHHLQKREKAFSGISLIRVLAKEIT